MRLINQIGTSVASVFLAAFVSFSTLGRSAFGADQQEQFGKLAFAEELATAARQAIPGTASSKELAQAALHRSAALLRAACEECNFEPRFPRLYAEACRQMEDRDGAINGLLRYRQIALPAVKNDQFAQVELIDLVTETKQDNDAKIVYLKPLIKNTALPEAVRSHIAFALSRLLDAKLDARGAKAEIDESLQLNPLNPEALRAKYAELQNDGTAADRVALLVSRLKSNPIQPDVMGLLATELASAGQLDAAVPWYQRSFTASTEIGAGLDPSLYLDYATTLQLTGQPSKADDAAASVLNSKPTNARAATLRLLIARQLVHAPISGSRAADSLTITRAQQALLAAIAGQIGGMHAELHGQSTSQPTTTQPYDLLSTIDSDSPRLRAFHSGTRNQVQSDFLDNYAAAVTNLAWYYIYFDPQPAKGDRLLDMLKSIVNDGDGELTRLQGFSFLKAGKKDEARVKLSAVADKDPLAKMGLILLDPSAPNAAADASKLVTQYPSGILGLTLLDGLRDKNGKVVTDDASIAAATAAQAFPLDLLDFGSPAKTQQFYSLLAQPEHPATQFDEPVLVDVSIQNTGSYDLSIGPDSAIHPDLWFDVFALGGSNPHFEGVAYDRLAGPLVLKAHHPEQLGTLQSIRVDQGDLADYLTQHPTIALSMNFSVFCNPISQSSGIAPGPGGYRQQFSQPTEREASPISTPQQVQDVMKPALNGSPWEKIHGLRLLGSYVAYLRNQMTPAKTQPAGGAPPLGAGEMPPPGGVGEAGGGAGIGAAGPNAKQNAANMKAMQNIIDSFTAAIQSDLRDPSKLVRYRAQYEAALLGDDTNRLNSAMTLLQGEDWEQRILGLMLATTLSPDRTKQLAMITANDPQDWMKSLSLAMTTLATSTPTTAPTTAPESSRSSSLNAQ